MRLGFTATALAAVALAATSVTAPCFDRNPLQPGDVATGDILVPFTFDEFPIQGVRGAVMTMSLVPVGSRGFRPTLGVYTDDYAAVALVGVGATTARTAEPVGSGRYRIIVGGGGGGTGAYRLKTKVQPARRFVLTGGHGPESPVLKFGAYAGFDATAKLAWRGASAVTLTSVVGPDGVAIAGAAAPTASSRTFTQGGFHAAVSGDHELRFEVPADVVAWTATVTVSGRLAPGVARDLRTTAPPDAPTVGFPAPGLFPIVAVTGEVGGPNECILSAAASLPDAVFLDGGAGAGGCGRTPTEEGPSPTSYLVGCYDGFTAEIVDVVRYEAGPWAGSVRSFVARRIVTPQGSGRATLSDFTYDARGRPTGWTETRVFDASGRAHSLVFTDAEYFSGGSYCKGFRVTHAAPDGSSHVYDYAPFR
jgi:hypothetical protein